MAGTGYRRTFARVGASMLVGSIVMTGFAGVASAAAGGGGGGGGGAPGGNNGTVKVGGSVADPKPNSNANDPHVSCPIQIQWTGFDAAPATHDYTVTFTGVAPTGGTVSPSPVSSQFTGADNTATFSPVVTGAKANKKGEYHVQIDIVTTTSAGNDTKSKTVWLQSCTAAIGVTKTGTSHAPPGGAVSYTVTVTNNGNAASTPPTTVTDTLPTGIDPGHMDFTSGAGTWTCANNTAAAASQTPSCVTNSALQPGASAVFTVTSTVSATATPGTTLTDTAAVGNDSDTADTLVDAAAPVTFHDLVLTASCTQPLNNTVTYTVTNPSTNTLTATGLAATNGAALSATSLAPGASATFTTAAPSGSVTVNGTAGGNAVHSNSRDFTGSCTPGSNPVETPASAAFSSTCTGIHAVFTTASLHTTQFVVSKPTGGTDTVSGSGTRDYSADSTNHHLSVGFDGNTQTFDWTDPGGCTVTPPAGTTDPAVSASNACKSGITVELSDMNGTLPVTFTVTKPDGTTENVDVTPGQIVKKSYAVKEDTTGIVTVTAPGLATKTVKYAKNCTSVLGEKVTKTPKPKPKPSTAVLGEKVTRLPFTGSETSMWLRLAAVLFAAGLVLMFFARRRPEGNHL